MTLIFINNIPTFLKNLDNNLKDSNQLKMAATKATLPWYRKKWVKEDVKKNRRV